MQTIEDKIKDTLQCIIDKRTSWKDSTAFADSPEKFGITLPTHKASLYAVSHLLRHLENSDLLEGKRVPETEGDRLFYQFNLGITEIYDNACLDVTSEQTKLIITTTRPPEMVLAYLRAADVSAQAELDGLGERERLEEHARHSRREKENTDPVIDAATDVALVRSYLSQMAEMHFSGSKSIARDIAVSPPIDMEGNTLDGSIRSFKKTGVMPRIDIGYTYDSEDYYDHNEFYSKLCEIFDSSSVSFSSPDSTRGVSVTESVRGNPSRLLKDIIRHDTAGAQRCAAQHGVTIPENI